MQHAAFSVHLIEFHPAGFRHAQAMPKHQEQQATVTGFIPGALNRFNQPCNLAPGEVLPVGVLLARVSVFAPVHRFVESLACPVPLKLVPDGQGSFALSTKGFILSRVKPDGARAGDLRLRFATREALSLLACGRVCNLTHSDTGWGARGGYYGNSVST